LNTWGEQVKRSFAVMMSLLLVFTLFTPDVTWANEVEQDDGSILEGSYEEQEQGTPTISVKNYKSTDLVYQSNITLEIVALDGNNEQILPTVKLGENVIEPSEVGMYDVNLTEGMNIFDLSVTDDIGRGVQERFILTYSKVKVVDFVPAPGQFTNTSFTTDAERKVRSKSGGLISLGGFGGYVTVKFEEPVKNDPKSPYGMDFTVFGNPFEISGQLGVYNQEPGAVEVAQSIDGPWYHLAGSEYNNEDTYKDYEVTYWNPQFESENSGKWFDNKGNEGIIGKDQYPKAEDFPSVNPESYTLKGVSILNSVQASDIGTSRKQVRFGYVDATPKLNDNYSAPNNPYTRQLQGSGGDAMDISWAVDDAGNRVHLDEIQYVKIYTAVNKRLGALGEISTEVNQLGATSPIGVIPASIKIKNEGDITELPIGESLQFFADGFDESENPVTVPDVRWRSSDDSIIKADPITGTVTSVSGGSATITGYLNMDEAVKAEFVITAGEQAIPTKLQLTTTGNYTIANDSTVIVTATVIDQYGNKIETDGVDWSTNKEELVAINPFLSRDYQRNIKGLKQGYANIKAAFKGVESSVTIQIVDKELNVRADNNKTMTAKSIVNNNNAIKAIKKALEKNKEKIHLTVINVSDDRNGDFIKIPVNTLVASDEASVSLRIEARDNSYQLPKSLVNADEFDDVDKYSLFFLSEFSQIENVPEGLNPVGKAVQYKLDLAKDNVPVQVINDFALNQKSEMTINFANHDLKDVDIDKLSVFYYSPSLEEWLPVGGEYNEEAKSISFTASHPGKFAVFESNLIPVKVRIEGYDKTIVPLTEINIAPYDITHAVGDNGIGNWHLKNDAPLGIHAIVKALELKGFDVKEPSKFDFGKGNFITNIDGLKMNSVVQSNDGWMYAVNNEFAPVGIGNYILKANDEVTLYFTTSYSDVDYSWFDKTEISTNTNEDIELQLKTNGNPVENAVILVNDKPLLIDGEEVLTNTEGITKFKISEPGKYHISAKRLNGEFSNITRPYSNITVEQGSEIVPDTQDIAVQIQVNGLKGETLTNDTVDLLENQTVLDALKIALTTSGTPYEIYVNESREFLKSIGGVESIILGGKAGWNYAVNGIEKNVEPSEYELKNNDNIEFYFSRFPEIETTSKVFNGTVDPAITVTLVGDTFSHSVREKSNWSLQAGTTQLELDSVDFESDQKVTLNLKGDAQAGTFSFAALAGALAGNLDSEAIAFQINPIDKVDDMLSKTLSFYRNGRYEDKNFKWGIPEISWTEIVALNAAGYDLTNGTLEMPSWVSEDPKLSANTGDTEHIRYIYGLLALEENPSKAWETNRNLFAELAAQQKEDGSIGAINKHAWAMLALDAGEKLGYNVGNWNEEAKSKALTYLLSQEKNSGGFSLSLGVAEVPDADMTGMVLLALANYQDESAVNEAIERAKTALRVIQLDTAGWGSWGSENANSIATVISGLIAIGEDPLSESWKKGEFTPLDALMPYQIDNGAFTFMLGKNASVNQMATEQSLIAMQEIKTAKSIWQQLTVGNPGGTDPKPEEPKKVIVEKDKPFELAVEDNDVAASPIILTFTNFTLPSITAERAGAKLEIPEGTSVTSDWNKELQAPTEQTTSLDNKGEIQNALTEKTLKRIGAHIKVGGDSPIVFDKYVTLQFKGLENLEAGFIGSDGKFTLIPKKTNSSSTEDVYAYTDGNDLIIKTKHFTEFLVFETEEKVVTPPTGGNDGTPQPSTKIVKFSIEKRTVDSTDIISEIPVTLNAGETAFTLLERIAAEKNISLSASGSGPSVYVKSIGGLAEFHEGQQSGWMYSVNGVFPEYTAGSYILKDGDTLRWQYTKDLGKDLGGYIPDSGGGGSTPTPQPETPVKPLEFTDISKHWAKDYIQKAVQLEIFKGYSDKTFRPDNYLTRAQAVSVIVRALDMKTDEAAPFSDIGTYAKETQAEIAAAYKHGLIKKQDGKFSPSNEVTRAQMALMLHRAHEYKTGEKYVAAQRAPYTDFGGYNDEAINAISMLHELNIATGDKGKYLPSNSTSRAHVAKMLINSLEQ